MEASHKYPFGIIGNCSYMSYIDNTGNVVWQCWPQFDSSFIFGSMLDEEKGGEFAIRPATSYSSTQHYMENTNILVTEFTCSDGKFKLIDFAPRFELFERFHRPLMLFRKIVLVEGSPQVVVTCRPTGDYGQIQARPQVGSNHIQFEGLDSKVRLTTNISKPNIISGRPFALTENKYLVLSYGIHLEAPLERTFEEFYQRTRDYWRKWVERASIPNIYQREVIRSALILKLHQYEDTGAIIASGTTSLPEYPGHGRNWDYRYCWVRDTYFTLSALMSLGHFSEAERYSHYIQNIAQNEKGFFQPMYSILGERELVEKELPLKGYLGNQPVRIGNDAFRQVQHDVYGQMILALMPLFTDFRIFENKSAPSGELIHKILDNIIKVIDSPDSGIWEFRGIFQRHAESYLFHWAGAKAAIKISHVLGDKSMRAKAERLVKESAQRIEQCYDDSKEAYGMSLENKHLNASEFLLITMGYLDRDSDIAKKHLKGLEKELKTPNDLIYRYRALDDFGETHSTFLICGFWYAEALAAIGEVQRAREVFEGLLKCANGLGIFSEDICPQNGSQWGNVAQTYSHVGLINCAFKIARRIDQPDFI